MTTTTQRKPKDLKRLVTRVLVTLLYPSLVFLPFIPELYLPIESVFRRHMLRIATCVTLLTLATKLLKDLRFHAICSFVEVVALLGTLFFPPADSPGSDAPFLHTYSPFAPEDSYEPYMWLNAWIGYPGDGWLLSMVSLGVAYVVHVLWRLAIHEEVSYPVVRLPALMKARRGKRKPPASLQVPPISAKVPLLSHLRAEEVKKV
ncbi:hypothetical protein LshimejAT787_0201940 [Lyophyllum shimeji]|uniref:Uncharacterized protein n=1 Tax=Lyophyllum shimeji TaxID=47721 RepID=A0A9P3UHX7_LYOSH|nr:hypothetical protein LshimejAT787_0201940 [Lyophyllum shimeji]